MRTGIFALAMMVTTACAERSGAPPPLQNGSTSPAPGPTEASLEVMTADERCAATAARAVPCTDELLVAQAHAMGIDGFELPSNAGRRPDPQGDLAIHEANCIAEEDYPYVIASCWSTPDCAVLAACVTDGLRAPGSRRAR